MTKKRCPDCREKKRLIQVEDVARCLECQSKSEEESFAKKAPRG